MPEYEKIARSMLNLDLKDDLPPSLSHTLERVDELCRLAGGKLQSRQVIALLIHFWETR